MPAENAGAGGETSPLNSLPWHGMEAEIDSITVSSVVAVGRLDPRRSIQLWRADLLAHPEHVCFASASVLEKIAAKGTRASKSGRSEEESCDK